MKNKQHFSAYYALYKKGRKNETKMHNEICTIYERFSE